MMPDPLKPSPRLLCKLGSIIVHADEFLSDDGHDFDRQSLLVGLMDGEVKACIKGMNSMSLLPVKRKSNPND